MERKMPEHKMSFGNKVRKLFGGTPKDESITGESPDGRITTTKIKYNDDFSIHNMTIISLDTSGDTSIKTEYRDDGTATETHFDYNGKITQKTDINSDGSYTEIVKQNDESYTSTIYKSDKVSEVQHLDKDMKPITAANENGDSMINGYVVQGEIGYDLAKRFLSATEEEKEKIISDAKDFSLECPGYKATGTYNINGENIRFSDGERYTGVRCTRATRKRAYYHVYIDGIDTGVGFGDGRYVGEEGKLGDIKYEQQMSLLEKAQKAIESGDKETLAALREEARNYENEWQKFKANYKMEAVRENIASTKETTVEEAPITEPKETQQTNVSKMQIAEMIANSKINE
ncbi:MAG: hypothetical protein IJZ59_06680 [Alphaproteobacteria bacterium]|nr:hypothetical protein [Alphaproteobacteria bacterium]